MSRDFPINIFFSREVERGRITAPPPASSLLAASVLLALQVETDNFLFFADFQRIQYASAGRRGKRGAKGDSGRAGPPGVPGKAGPQGFPVRILEF